MPYDKNNEGTGWEGRVFPWEFVVSAATRSLRRRGEPLAVLRQLQHADSPRRMTVRAPTKVLYVESAPGPLANAYSFESERSLLKANFENAAFTWSELRNPTSAQLREEIVGKSPDVIHLAGFDIHQGSRLLSSEQGRGLRGVVSTVLKATRSLAEVSSAADGYVMADDKEGFVGILAPDLAAILTAGKDKPVLVSCNIWNSARRICPLIVANGASSAIGFQDSFDDGVVEAFFSTLYRSWREAEWNLRDAFLAAWNRVRSQPSGLIGTGLVLWSEMPLVGPGAERHPAETARHNKLKEQRSS